MRRMEVLDSRSSTVADIYWAPSTCQVPEAFYMYQFSLPQILR